MNHKSTTLVVSAVALSLLALFGGCRSSSPSQNAAAPDWVKDTVDGVSYEVRGQGETRSLAGDGFHELTAGKNKLRLQNGRITVNDKDYGTVKAGDTVVVDVDGTVAVNGEARK